MALVVADRVQETTSNAAGTSGSYTLDGAKDGFQSFAVVGDGNTTYYACTDGTDYEVGIGTYTASGTTLARTTIIESSNSNAAVNWSSTTTKDIFVTLPASKAVYEDSNNKVSFANDLDVTYGNVSFTGTQPDYSATASGLFDSISSTNVDLYTNNRGHNSNLTPSTGYVAQLANRVYNLSVNSTGISFRLYGNVISQNANDQWSSTTDIHYSDVTLNWSGATVVTVSNAGTFTASSNLPGTTYFLGTSELDNAISAAAEAAGVSSNLYDWIPDEVTVTESSDVFRARIAGSSTDLDTYSFTQNSSTVYLYGHYVVAGRFLILSQYPNQNDAAFNDSSAAANPDTEITVARFDRSVQTQITPFGVVTTSNGNLNLDPNGSGKVVLKGNSTRGAGQFVLNCEQNTHGITVKGPPHSAGATYTLTLPDTDGNASEFLQTDGSGNLSWATGTSYTHPNHTGEVTSTGDGATVIADDVVDEANLKVSNTPTDGYVLTARSGNTGGMTWEAASGGGGIALTDLSVTQNTASGSGTLSYDNTSGVFSYTPPVISGGGGSSTSALTETTFSATANQTAFPVSGGITNAANISVFQNGVKLEEGASKDYTASASTNTVTLNSGAAAGDVVEVLEYGQPNSITDLSDTPSSLGTAGQALVVNSGGTALEFGSVSGGSMTVYNDLNGTDGTPSGYTYLTNASNPSNGDLAFVTANNTVYVRAASGWRKIATIQESPSAVTGQAASYPDIGQNATTDITLSTTDPEGFDVTWSYVVGGNGTLSGSNINNSNGDTLASIAVQTANSNSGGTNTITYRITRQTTTIAGDFTITFTATDSQSTGTSDTGAISFELAFVIADSHYTSLLMATDGSAGNNKDDISDATGNHTITPYGDAHAGTFSPYRHGGYSTYFDGSGDDLTIADHTSFDFGTSDFTIETWFYLASDDGTYTICAQYSSGNNGGIWLGRWANGFVFRRSSIADVITASSPPSANEWHHVAVSRSSGSTRMFIDGTQVGSTVTSDTNNYSVSAPMNIGSDGDATDNQRLNGYLSDFRIVKGTGLYTDNFPPPPPTERLTTVSGTGYSTSLLTCHLPYIVDGSSNGHSITVNGDPETKPFGPYDYAEYSESTNGGSVYFDGDGDYIGVGSAIVPTAYDTDYTIEMWIYPTTTGSREDIFNQYAATASGRMAININTDATISFFQNGLSPAETKSSAISANNWYHLAVVNSSGTRSFYVNGSLIGTATGTVSMYSGNTEIGRLGDVGSNYFTGYITDVRVVNGTAVYSGAFAPPSGPLTTTGGTYPSTTNVNTSITASNTKLLLKGTDAHVIDKSQVSNLKLVGNAAASTTQAKFSNTASVYFDGDADEIAYTVPTLSGNFTFEAFIYPESQIQSFPICFAPVWDATAGNRIVLSYDTSTDVDKFSCRVGSNFIVPSSTSSTGQWYHLAVVRSGSTVSMYIDGIRIGTQTYSGSISSRTGYIGGNISNSTGGAFKGYIQDFRVTNGLARYTAADESSNIPSAPLKG